MIKAVLIISLLLLINQCQASISCLSPQGNQVDWFIVLKAPKAIDPQGVAFDYMDSTKTTSFTQYSNINSATSPVYQTVSQIKNLNNKSQIQYFWNDEDGEKTHSTQAHAKGMIGGDSSSIFILEHSVPNYPLDKSGTVDTNLPDTGLKYGQHFFCVTVNLKNLQSYQEALSIIRPYVFPFSNIPTSLESELSDLVNLKNNSKTSKVEQLIQPIKSLGGMSLKKFAKNKDYVVQLYANIVAPYYKVDMEFETWVNGQGGLQGPYCGQYTVVTVQKVQLSMGTFTTNQDHSKYGVSMVGSVVCFADLNRFDSQDKRGGGSFCFVNTNISKLIRDQFLERQQCTTMDYLDLVFQSLMSPFQESDKSFLSLTE